MARAATALREAGHDGADRVRTHHASSERKARRGSARHRPPPYELTAGEFDGRVGVGALAKVVDTRDLPVVDVVLGTDQLERIDFARRVSLRCEHLDDLRRAMADPLIFDA